MENRKMLNETQNSLHNAVSSTPPGSVLIVFHVTPPRHNVEFTDAAHSVEEISIARTVRQNTLDDRS
jgi:hypothetical protein